MIQHSVGSNKKKNINPVDEEQQHQAQEQHKEADPDFYNAVLSFFQSKN